MRGRYGELNGRFDTTVKAREAELARLRGELETVRSRPVPPPEVKLVERVVYRDREVPVERVVEKLVEKPVERIVYRDRVTTQPKAPKPPAPKKAAEPIVKKAAKKAPKKRAERKPDDLKLIYGVGPVLEKFLHKHGIKWFRQVAKWDKRQIEKFERLLPNFAGRIERENWVRSAIEEHYKKYGKWLGTGQPRIIMPETR